MKDRFLVDPVAFYNRHQITPELLQDVGGIGFVSGSIEFWAERLKWALGQEDVKGKRPSTDAKVISDVIGMIASLGRGLTNLEPVPDAEWPEQLERPRFAPDDFHLFQSLIDCWCEGAKEAFECRNTLLHGLMVPGRDGSVTFLNNTRWQDVIRKRDFTSFYGSANTLRLLHRVFLDLLSGAWALTQVAEGTQSPQEALGQTRMDSLTHARSIAVELNHLAEAVNDERY